MGRSCSESDRQLMNQAVHRMATGDGRDLENSKAEDDRMAS